MIEVTPFDRLELEAHEIYYGLVRLGDFGEYGYYTKPWKEKILFNLPPYVVEAHNKGILKTLTLIELEDGEWTFRSFTIYYNPIPPGRKGAPKYRKLKIVT